MTMRGFSASSLVLNFHNLSYRERLTECQIPSISKRATQYDPVQTYRTLNNPAFPLQLNHTSHIHQHNHRSSSHLSTIHSRLIDRQRFFSVRAIQTWNSTPLHIRESPSISTLKRRLTKWQKTLHETDVDVTNKSNFFIP
eukprot:GHVN01101153.1.p1 GENE.GHVN01101153.1~~GHVN01101153.1.p1  ORF type:complete len:140 (-),score=12.46 GHVN01101153.1:156-575(-)